MSAYRERPETGAPGLEQAKSPRPPLDFEEEDEKENDRHRWRTRQSRDDPGAKACEATCIFCVGMLFLQVAYIVYTYGLHGTMTLLMSPEGGGLPPPRVVVTYETTGTMPEGYDPQLVIVHDQAAMVQRMHFNENGNVRVVMYNANTHTTNLLFYAPAVEGPESSVLQACYSLHNDTSLRYGLLHPYDTFSQHGAFRAVEETLEVTAPPAFDPSTCTPLSRTSFADLSWTLSNWTADAEIGVPLDDNTAKLPMPSYGKWCGVDRGGFHDCCSGAKCTACDLSQGLTQECLRQCPPVDAADNACAKHHECTLDNPALPGCAPGFRCQCDAALLTAVKGTGCHANKPCAEFQTAMQQHFEEGRACWGADYSCLHVPCTTAPNGFCKQCAYYKKCHRRGAPYFTD